MNQFLAERSAVDKLKRRNFTPVPSKNRVMTPNCDLLRYDIPDMLTRTLSILFFTALVFGGGFWLGVERTQAANANRVFELRTYYTFEGKLPDLQARFRNHTTTIFQNHNMTNIGYWVPQDEPKSKNTLIYIIAHPSREAANKNWDAFRTDPEWMNMDAASEANGKIVEKVESVYMDPTDYSFIK